MFASSFNDVKVLFVGVEVPVISLAAEKGVGVQRGHLLRDVYKSVVKGDGIKVREVKPNNGMPVATVFVAFVMRSVAFVAGDVLPCGVPPAEVR